MAFDEAFLALVLGGPEFDLTFPHGRHLVGLRDLLFAGSVFEELEIGRGIVDVGLGLGQLGALFARGERGNDLARLDGIAVGNQHFGNLVLELRADRRVLHRHNAAAAADFVLVGQETRGNEHHEQADADRPAEEWAAPEANGRANTRPGRLGRLLSRDSRRFFAGWSFFFLDDHVTQASVVSGIRL